MGVLSCEIPDLRYSINSLLNSMGDSSEGNLILDIPEVIKNIYNLENNLKNIIKAMENKKTSLSCTVNSFDEAVYPDDFDDDFFCYNDTSFI